MHARELLTDSFAYMPPGRMLDGLSSEDAERIVAGGTHSIAQIVAHVSFWLDWFRRRCDGVAEPMAATAALGWPDVAPGSWPRVRQQFLDGLESLVAIGKDADRLGTRITPAIEFPPLAECTIHDVLVHVAQHNSYHLGQIVVLRQMMGLWPPPSGSYTW